MSKKQVRLGRIVVSELAARAIETWKIKPMKLLSRHSARDYGEEINNSPLAKLNDYCVRLEFGRVISLYKTGW